MGGFAERADAVADADVCSDDVRHAVAIDDNAGFSGALALLAQQQTLR
jgi:hypothetical protein